MEKEFIDLLKKKAAEQSKNPVDQKHLDAKKSVVQGIMDMLKGGMAEDIGGLKKVSVAAPNKAGLEKGLEMAKGIVSKNPLEESSDEESLESPEEELGEDESMEGDSDDSKIAELEKQLAELKAKKINC
jgi:hypothetical protein